MGSEVSFFNNQCGVGFGIFRKKQINTLTADSQNTHKSYICLPNKFATSLLTLQLFDVVNGCASSWRGRTGVMFINQLCPGPIYTQNMQIYGHNYVLVIHGNTLNINKGY